jgi:hypothetical protein
MKLMQQLSKMKTRRDEADHEYLLRVNIRLQFATDRNKLLFRLGPSSATRAEANDYEALRQKLNEHVFTARPLFAGCKATWRIPALRVHPAPRPLKARR